MKRVAVVLLPLLLAAAPPPQDARRWAEAKALYARSGAHREPAKRARAVETVALATTPKVDKECWKILSVSLRREVARGGRDGRTEVQVSGLVLETCIEAMRRITDKETLAAMMNVARSAREAPRIRHCVVWGLGPNGDVDALAKLADDRVALVQVAAVGALAERGERGAVPMFVRILRDASRTWEVRLLAAEGLRAAGDKTVVGDLIAELGNVAGTAGRLKDSMLVALRELTGLDLESDDPNAWKAAWAAKQAGGAIPEGRTITAPTEFYGLKTRSTRIVFVLDRTGSMEMPMSEPKRAAFVLPPEARTDPKKDPREDAARRLAENIKAKWDARLVRTRLGAAKKELIRTVYVLHPRVQFNVVWFESKPAPWRQALVPASWKNKLDCIRQAEKITPGGSTNIWDGLEQALRITPDPKKPDVLRLDRRVNYASALGGADTIYLLADGRPNEGRLPNAGAILAELRKVNRLRRIRIHTICLGEEVPGLPENAPENPDPVFLQRVAQESGGEFTHFK